MTTVQPASHSATVRLELLVGNQVFFLRQTAPDFIDVRDPVNMTPCEGSVVVWIDGHEHRRRVSLIDGMSQSCERVRVVGIA